MFCRNIRYKYKKPLWLRCYNVIKLNLSVVYNLFSENWNFQAWQVLTAVTLVCNLRCAFKYKNLRSSLNHFPLFLAMMATPRSEVYQWLCSISNGLQLERLAGEFESRGFRTVDSLKYIKSSDLDVLFPSPHKLMMAEKRIIESEIEKVKSLKSGQLPPREPFPALPRQVWSESYIHQPFCGKCCLSKQHQHQQNFSSYRQSHPAYIISQKKRRRSQTWQWLIGCANSNC